MYRPITFKQFICIAVGGYLILTTVLIISAYRSVNIDEFTKLGTVGVAILTGLLTISVSTFTAYRSYLTEQEKGEQNMKLAEIGSQFNKQLAELNSKLAGELEFNKHKMSWKLKAYDELSNLVSQLYYALAVAETGKFDRDVLKAANTFAVNSRRYLITCKDEDQKLYDTFLQEARMIEERLEPAADADRMEIWAEEVAAFGDRLKAFHLAAQQAFLHFE